MINNHHQRALYDTGASVSLISKSLCQKLNLNINPSSIKIITADNNSTSVAGRVITKIQIGLISRQAEILVLPKTSFPLILGLDLIKTFALEQTKFMEVEQRIDTEKIKISYVQESNQEEKEQEKLTNPKISSLLSKFPKIFAIHKFDVGHLSNEICKIHLTNNIPINIRPYRVSEQDNEKIGQQITRLKAMGLISESNSPYSFPVVLTNKKDEGQRTRLCVDYRQLNKTTITESYPFPLIEELTDRIRDCKFFSTLDVASGFYHIQVQAEDRNKTAFVTMHGKYEWNVMPFGLKNAPVIFQRAIHRILQNYKLTTFAVNYIDDILIFSTSEDEHMQHLTKVLNALDTEKIKLKESKCKFLLSKVDYLGHTISYNSISPLQSNVRAISNLPTPSNIKEVRRLLGKVNYYRKYIPNCTKLLTPITRLTRKNTPFDFNNDCKNAFNKVLRLLSEPPILTIYNKDKTCHVFVDASRKGIGAVLKQPDEQKKLLPVCYFSKSLTEYQKNYTVTELECLALVEALRTWQHHLYGKKFVVHTDHSSLQWILKHKQPNTRLFRWSTELSQYDFSIEHLPGKANIEADELSRNTNEVYAINIYSNIFDQINRANAETLTTGIIPSNCKVTNNNITYKGKTFVPPDLRKELIKLYHQRNAHFGYLKITPEIKNKYNWPKMTLTIKNFVKKCDVCRRNKTRPSNNSGLYHPGKVNRPFELISIDTVGGFSGYGSNKKYAHLAIDHFSRYAWCFTSKSQSAPDFINLLNKILKDGKPKTIRTDNYPALKSAHFLKFLTNHNISLQHSPPNSPESLGIVERLNQTLTNQLRTVIQDPDIRKKNWSKLLHEIISIYNSSIHSTTKNTPETGLFNSNKTIQEKIIKNNRKDQIRNANGKNKHRKASRYKRGDMVLVFNATGPNRKKLDPLYIGPGIVQGKTSNTIYKISLNDKISQQNIRNLIRYHPP